MGVYGKKVSKMHDLLSEYTFSKRDKFFLACGYFLDNKPNVRLAVNPESYNSALDSYTDLISDFKVNWKHTIKKLYDERKYESDLVLLSGGVDSRAILLSLLEYKDPANINTLTFGSRGSLDFKIGNQIAKYYGTSHRNVIMDDYSFDLNDTIEFGKSTGFSTNLFFTPPMSVFTNYSSCNIWSGTVIDVCFGRHKHNIEDPKNIDLHKQFLDENLLVSELQNNVPIDYIRDNLDIPFNVGCSAHVADLWNRQIKFVSRHLLLQNYNFVNMLEPNLVAFGWKLPPDKLLNQSLYIDGLTSLFKDFNKFGCKTNHGARLDSSILVKNLYRAKNKFNRTSALNYMDWDRFIRISNFSKLYEFLESQDEIILIKKAIESKMNSYFILNLISLVIIKKMAS